MQIKILEQVYTFDGTLNEDEKALLVDVIATRALTAAPEEDLDRIWLEILEVVNSTEQ